MPRATLSPIESSPEIGAFSPELEWSHVAEQAQYHDDFATWAAEALHGSMRSTFTFGYEDGDIVAHDGRRLHDVFKNALESTDALMQHEPQLQFELRRRILEYEEYEDMLQLAEGNSANTMVVVSDFPAELMQARQDTGGYNADRKTAFLRVISKDTDGGLSITSQTLDRSDRAGLEAIYHSFGVSPDAGELLGQRIHADLPPEEQAMLADRLTGVYDNELHQRHGGEWYAGRQGEDRQDTYDFVQAQTDLLDVFVQAKLHNPDSAEDLRGNIIAAIDARFQQHRGEAPNKKHAEQNNYEYVDDALARQESLAIEIQEASNYAFVNDITYSGCGITISQEESGNPDNPLEALGYGMKAGEDRYGSLKFTCQKGHPNTRPRNIIIPNCKICGISIKC